MKTFCESLAGEKDLLSTATLQVPVQCSIEDMAWSSESTDSEYLALLYSTGVLGLYQHGEDNELGLINTVHSPKTIDAFCWNKDHLSFVCCYQDGSLSHYKLDGTNSPQVIFTLNLAIILDELCLRLHCPLPSTLVWEGTQGSMVLIDLAQKVAKAISGDFGSIPLAVAGKFNEGGEESAFYCGKNWARVEKSSSTLVGVSQINGVLVCPNYFSVLQESEELLILSLTDFSYKLTWEQVKFLQSSGKAGRINTKNHIEVIEWSPFVETADYFVTYDICDHLVLWKCAKMKAAAQLDVEYNGVGIILWIDTNKLLLVQNQQIFTTIQFNIH